jgi:sec-independent protein translocase protein TatB
MIDLSWSHILIVLIVALVVVGPKDLPRLMHVIGRWMAKARAMADQFKKSFDEMSRQAELDELRAEIQALRNEQPFAGIEQTLHQPVMPTETLPSYDTGATGREPTDTHEDSPPAPLEPGSNPPAP